MTGLEKRLKAIESLENELITKAQTILKSGSSLTIMDTFVFGAIKRTLSQSLGFRKLIEGRNFSCATILLRTQIDTAMRINGISLLANPETDIKRVFDEELTFNKLKTSDGKTTMTDKYLREQLSQAHQWVTPLYEETSDFVHLSFRHLWPSIVSTDDEKGMVYLAMSGEDPQREQGQYHQVADAFCKVSQLTSTILLGILTARHDAVKGSTEAE